MREIKFRQLMNDGSFHYWGYLEDTDSRYPIFTGPLGRNDCQNNADSEQYTGLKDRDGVEIYEGDVVEFHGHYFNGGSFDNDFIAIGAVEITEYCELCIKVLRREQGGLNNKYFHVADTTHFEEPCIKVVGNIHEDLFDDSI